MIDIANKTQLNIESKAKNPDNLLALKMKEHIAFIKALQHTQELNQETIEHVIQYAVLFVSAFGAEEKYPESCILRQISDVERLSRYLDWIKIGVNTADFNEFLAIQIANTQENPTYFKDNNFKEQFQQALIQLPTEGNSQNLENLDRPLSLTMKLLEQDKVNIKESQYK